ncbi:NACHT domain-containing protein [Micromonospora sp. NPDC048898]|uniref:NACHT domain-containing protein n=1 Tax=Micromonospora sp. NPDC048898 TaxID=3364260 RepID=UPI003724A170
MLVIPLITAVVGVLVNVATAGVEVESAFGRIAIWMALLLVSIVGGAIAWRLGRPVEKDPLGRAVTSLRRDLQRRWMTDPVWRSVREGDRLPVRWDAVPTALFPANNRAWQERKRLGDGARLAALVTATGAPSRLVVLGEAGSGKTELLVGAFQSLLDRSGDDRRVPVFVPMTAWRSADDPRRWLVDWLTTNHGFLRQPVSADDGRTLAHALAEDNRLIFILDGFDEIAPEHRADVLRSLNTLPSAWPVLLSSRTSEYQALRNVGRVLTDARGIVIKPQRREQVMRYLKNRSESPERWAEVENRIPRAPVLTKAFETPLMVTLADAIYNAEPSRKDGSNVPEPSDLLAYRDGAALAHHLLGDVVTARYPTDRSGRWPRVGQARRWLGYLAAATDSDDIRWWDLPVPAAATQGVWVRNVATAFVVVAWTALSAGLLNEWIFTEPYTGVTNALRISAAALLVYLVFLYLTGAYSDAVLASVGAYIAGCLSGTYDLAVVIGLVVGFSWRFSWHGELPRMRRGRLRDAVLVGAAAAVAAAAIRGAGELLPLTPSLTTGFASGSVDGFTSRWDEEVNGFLATGLVVTLTAWAGLVVDRGRTALQVRGWLARPLVHGLAVGVVVTAVNSWADRFGKVEHAWLIAPADGFAAGLAVWWVSHWIHLWSEPTRPRRLPRPPLAGVVVGVVACILHTVGYSTRTDIHSGWSRALSEAICSAALVWLALDLAGRRTPARDIGGTPPPPRHLLRLTPAVAIALLAGALDAVSAGVARGVATAVGIGLVLVFLTARRAQRHVETSAAGASPVEVGIFALSLVGLLAGFAYGLLVGVVAALGCRVARDIARRRQPSGASPRPSLRGAGAGILLGSVPLMGAAYNGTAPVWLLAIGVTSGVAGAFAFGVDARDPERTAPVSPLGSYRQDRAASLFLTAVVALVIGLAVMARAMSVAGSLPVAFLAGLGTILTYGVSAGLVIAETSTRFPTFLVARTRLAYHGLLPWRSMTFLDDAHRAKQMLRSSGAAYQFRHRELKERLVEDSPG